MYKNCLYLAFFLLLLVAKTNAQDEFVYIKAGKLYDSQQNKVLEKKGNTSAGEQS